MMMMMMIKSKKLIHGNNSLKMSPLSPLFIIILLILLLVSSSSSARIITSSENAVVSSSSCPLNFTTLKTLIHQADVKPSNNVGANCGYISEGLRLVLSEYLRSTNSFYPPPNSSESCWESYESVVDSFIPNLNIRQSCNLSTSWISQGCMNISTRSEFDKLVPQPALNDAVSNCNQSLENSSPCASCLTSLTTLQASYLTGPTVGSGSISDCTNLPLIYAGALINQFGPSDPGTARCLFSLDFTNDSNSNSWKKKVIISVITVACFIALSSLFGAYLVFLRFKKRREIKKRRLRRVGGSASISKLPSSIGGSTTLIKFTIEELKQSTNNFHRHNLIGRGGYGNVYKGVLPNGNVIAIKRFKNCSAAGDAGFTHEVEVIASIRHVNLVELRGYCVATTKLEGHQRIIVCDLMENGSLHDHLFVDDLDKKLSWPMRQKIALGMARGLAYLHYGAQPAVIHRDIKASNILLDDHFEAKVCDFGLAKFNPEGFSHLSTRVAGTMGYVAPEYALYGQLTERSDVYSFGVVLLELLSGNKAILSVNDGQPSLVTDWAWALVRKGHALDVIEEGMPELGPSEVMEKYVMIAVLCSHPQLYARPTMDQVVKILETDLPVPSIPERPIPLVAELSEIERSASSSGSGNMSTSGGFQSFAMMNFDSTSTSMI